MNNIKKVKYDWFDIFVMSNDGIGIGLIKGQEWEPHLIKFLKNNSQKNLNFLDIGSNYGWHSIISSKLFKKVFSFEPQILLHNLQKESITENKIENIELYNFGLSNLNEEKTMNVINYNKDWINAGDLSIGNGGEKIVVKRLDDLNISDVGILKLDVQGYEKFVLEGGTETIKNNKPICVVELENFQMKKFGYDDAIIFKFFENLGYIPYLLDYEYPSDHIFVHESQLEVFKTKNKIQNLYTNNHLNNNFSNGVRFKIV